MQKSNWVHTFCASYLSSKILCNVEVHDVVLFHHEISYLTRYGSHNMTTLSVNKHSHTLTWYNLSGNCLCEVSSLLTSSVTDSSCVYVYIYSQCRDTNIHCTILTGPRQYSNPVLPFKRNNSDPTLSQRPINNDGAL